MKFDNWLGTFQAQILPLRSNGVMFNLDSSLIPVKLAVQLYQPIWLWNGITRNGCVCNASDFLQRLSLLIWKQWHFPLPSCHPFGQRDGLRALNGTRTAHKRTSFPFLQPLITVIVSNFWGCIDRRKSEICADFRSFGFSHSSRSMVLTKRNTALGTKKRTMTAKKEISWALCNLRLLTSCLIRKSPLSDITFRVTIVLTQTRRLSVETWTKTSWLYHGSRFFVKSNRELN